MKHTLLMNRLFRMTCESFKSTEYLHEIQRDVLLSRRISKFLTPNKWSLCLIFQTNGPIVLLVELFLNLSVYSASEHSVSSETSITIEEISTNSGVFGFFHEKSKCRWWVGSVQTSWTTLAFMSVRKAGLYGCLALSPMIGIFWVFSRIR